MERQRARAWQQGDLPGYSHDCYLFAVCLRRLYGMVESLNRHPAMDGELDGAMATFRDAVPAWANVRNVVVHEDAYLLGEGRLQKAGSVPRTPAGSFSFFSFEHVGLGVDGDDTPSAKTIIVDHTAAGHGDDPIDPAFRLSIEDAATAANELVDAVCEAVEQVWQED